MVALRRAPESPSPVGKFCHRCRAPMPSPIRFICCDACRVLERARAARAADEARAEGICSICKKLDAEAGYNTCADCKVRSNRLCGAAREAAVADGRCQRCRRGRAVSGGVTCRGCLSKRRKQWAALQRRRRGTGPERVMRAFEDHDELDLRDLAAKAKLSTRNTLRILRVLVPAGAVVVSEPEGPIRKKIYSRGYGARLVTP